MKTVPDALRDLVTTDHLGHVASIRPDGSIATHLMWIDWDGERLLTSSPVGSRKGRNWRENPQVSVSVVDPDDPWRYLVIRGRVTDIQPDEGLPSSTGCPSATSAGRTAAATRRARSSRSRPTMSAPRPGAAVETR